MGGNYVGNATTLLIETLFGLYILVVMLRLLLQYVRADFYNPVSQFIVKATQPPLQPFRRFIPGYRGIDLAALALALVVQFVELFLVTRVVGVPLGAPGLLVLSVARLIGLTLNIFLFAIIIQVVLSWVNPHAHNPVTALVYKLSEPLLAPARRLIPPIGGFDLSPIPVLLVLQIAKELIVAPISDIAMTLGG